ncbi:hypothetical protein UFOVP68_37 [uncultured Caudovirales phage]|jgi:hypothetical protein|uniref:Uncharacterized protein n=1 Tax=uncultured Caudovirales phage TaxID=2100421 RepID=A0A6J5KY59_9CAUD|nr:hypothetical protein UFOVP68_37 [uncultured Caudovirales phage]
MARLVPEQEVIRKLQVRDVLSLPRAQRRREIQLAIMEVPGLDPDDKYLIDRIEEALVRILPRVKSVTPLTDEDLGRLIGRSRPLVQACIGGRLPERLSAEALDALLAVVESRLPEIHNLIRDIKRARLHVE